MRKKFLILLFTAVATFASAFCLSACASELGTVDGGQSGIIYPSTGTEGNGAHLKPIRCEGWGWGGREGGRHAALMAV